MTSINWVIERGLLAHHDVKFSAISLNLSAYVDADHGRDIDTRRSVTAYVFLEVPMLAGSLNFSSVWRLQVCSLNIWPCVLHAYSLCS